MLHTDTDITQQAHAHRGSLPLGRSLHVPGGQFGQYVGQRFDNPTMQYYAEVKKDITDSVCHKHHNYPNALTALQLEKRQTSLTE